MNSELVIGTCLAKWDVALFELALLCKSQKVSLVACCTLWWTHAASTVFDGAYHRAKSICPNRLSGCTHDTSVRDLITRSTIVISNIAFYFALTFDEDIVVLTRKAFSFRRTRDTFTATGDTRTRGLFKKIPWRALLTNVKRLTDLTIFHARSASTPFCIVELRHRTRRKT